MILEPIATPIEERDGALRVKGSRIPVDTLVYRFHDGATPEDIAEDFPSLSLERIYAVIAYYLERRELLDAYLRNREVEAAELRAELETRQPPRVTRAELLRRRERAQGAVRG